MLLEKKLSLALIIELERSEDNHGLQSIRFVVFSHVVYLLFSLKTKDKIRTCILVKKDIYIFLVSNHSSSDETVAVFKRHGLLTLVLTSAYVYYDESNLSLSSERELINWWREKYYDEPNHTLT